MMKFKFFQDKVEPDRWRTHNGDILCVHDMTHEHIDNVVRCLIGEGNMRIPDPYQGKSHLEWLYIFRDELRRRGE